jgi:hypothetical protein
VPTAVLSRRVLFSPRSSTVSQHCTTAVWGIFDFRENESRRGSSGVNPDLTVYFLRNVDHCAVKSWTTVFIKLKRRARKKLLLLFLV